MSDGISEVWRESGGRDIAIKEQETRSDPRLAPLLARTRLVEERYKELEEDYPDLQPLSDEQIAAMNKHLGFRPGADNCKGQAYRPYCIQKGCGYRPRMYRIADGFRCWSCGHKWIINTEKKD